MTRRSAQIQNAQPTLSAWNPARRRKFDLRKRRDVGT
jgi:hypothetical protein